MQSIKTKSLETYQRWSPVGGDSLPVFTVVGSLLPGNQGSQIGMSVL